MQVSVFTPTHEPRWLLESLRTLRDQSFDEWVIVPNDGIHERDIPYDIRMDARVKLVECDGVDQCVGALKLLACQQCSGDALLELDHDDDLLASLGRLNQWKHCGMQ
jgi:hypothetical protein